jgi:hypothetical protein
MQIGGDLRCRADHSLGFLGGLGISCYMCRVATALICAWTDPLVTAWSKGAQGAGWSEADLPLLARGPVLRQAVDECFHGTGSVEQ